MMLLRWTLGCILICFAISSIVTDADEAPVCKDKQDWCALVTIFCNDTMYKNTMMSFCMKTCKFCTVPECRNKTCDHWCEKRPDNSVGCACNRGYKLASDMKSCIDVDECYERENACNVGKVCENIQGGFVCRKNMCAEFARDGWNLSQSYENKCCRHNPPGEQSCGVSSSSGIAELDLLLHSRIPLVAQRWRWQITIINNGFCGGILINQLWILSSAHCFKGLSNEPRIVLDVVPGYHGKQTMSKIRIFASGLVNFRIFRPEKYSSPNNNIALIRMPRKLSSFLRPTVPVCLPKGEIPPVGLKCFSVGYGNQTDEARMEELQLRIVDVEACKKAFEGDFEIDSDSMICAEPTKPKGKDYKDRESIGDAALICQRCESCNYFVAGVTSFGPSEGKQYIVYTKVEHFENWIEGVISGKNATKEKKKCILQHWGEWGEWGKCTEPCNIRGTQKRTRECTFGEIGKPGCLEEDFQIRTCKRCRKFTWDKWSKCSKSCGNGSQTRKRVCTSEICEPDKPGFKRSQTRKCNTNQCGSYIEY